VGRGLDGNINPVVGAHIVLGGFGEVVEIET
jgi:hypothetical protein